MTCDAMAEGENTRGTNAGPVAWTTPTAIDNVDGNITASIFVWLDGASYSAGTHITVGTHVVTFTAADTSGNTGTCTTTVTVKGGSQFTFNQQFKDTTLPIMINCIYDTTSYEIQYNLRDILYQTALI